MPTLTIRIKKNSDGTAALSCQRADGSVTWQRHTTRNGTFFTLHDLTHYAVETQLGFRHAFFGLLAAGWDISDFEAPGARDRLPPEALQVELIVGLLDTERADGACWTASQFHEQMAAYCASHNIDAGAGLSLTDQQLEAVRQERARLFAQWADLPAGATMELEF